MSCCCHDIGHTNDQKAVPKTKIFREEVHFFRKSVQICAQIMNCTSRKIYSRRSALLPGRFIRIFVFGTAFSHLCTYFLFSGNNSTPNSITTARKRARRGSPPSHPTTTTISNLSHCDQNNIDVSASLPPDSKAALTATREAIVSWGHLATWW